MDNTCPIMAHAGHNVYSSRFYTAIHPILKTVHKVVGQDEPGYNPDHLLLDMGETYVWVGTKDARPVL